MEQQPQNVTVVNKQYQQPSGLAIASMVLGIVSVVISLFWILSIPIAITAIVLGSVALVKKYTGKGMSIAGIVTGAVTLLIGIALIVITVLSYVAISNRANETQRQYEQSQRVKPEWITP